MENLHQLPPDIAPDFLIKQSRLILKSYEHWFGQSLIQQGECDQETAKSLFYAPFVVVSSDAEKDPILNYGNQKALGLWELSWEVFTRSPGRKTAEPMERKEREQFLQKVKSQGYVQDYRGIRISSTGRRFVIEQATVWNLLDSAGRFVGQAATFNDWKYLS